MATDTPKLPPNKKGTTDTGAGGGGGGGGPKLTKAQKERRQARQADRQQEKKELEKWLNRQNQLGLSGQGVLHGAGIEGTPGLIELLKSNPQLATRVRAWMDAQKALPGPLPGIAGAGGLQGQLLAQFPELYQQYVAGTGKSIIYDAAGNPVRLVDPNKYYGLREGDTLTTPTLYNEKGEEVPLPSIAERSPRAGATPDNYAMRFGAIPEGEQGGLAGASSAADQMLQARQAREAAMGNVFSLDEIQGEMG